MRTAATLLMLLCLLPAPATAQQPPATSSTASDPLLADLIRDWDAQKTRMLNVAEAMPAEKYDFKATPEQRTFAEQLAHLAEAHVSMLKPLDTAGRVPAPTLSKGHTPKDVVQSLTAAYDYGRAVLEAMDGPPHQSAGRSTRARTVWAAMNNAMNHYGQCVVYLRLNGIVPPASRK